MKKLIALLVAAALFTGITNAQISLEPIIGYQADFNNNKFKLLSTSLQFSFKESDEYELLLMLQKSWGFPATGNDSAFTTNTSLPLYTNAVKKIIPGVFSVALGHRITFTRKKSNNKLSLILYSGFTFQHFAVSYQYDKANYTILNPDRTLNRDGIFLSGGLEYMRILKKGRIFFQLLAATPPSGKESNYPGTFHAMAPVNINTGYSIRIQEKRKPKRK